MIHRRDALKAFTALSGALIARPLTAAAAGATKVRVTLVRWPYT